MLSIEETLRAAGARCVGGDLILRQELVGQYRNGQFSASLAGLAHFEQMQQEHNAAIVAIAREAIDNPDPDIGEISGLELATEPARRGRRAKDTK